MVKPWMGIKPRPQDAAPTPALIRLMRKLVALPKTTTAIVSGRSRGDIEPWFGGIANLGLYIFTEKYLALQTLLGLLGTAVLNFVIVGMVVSIRKKAKQK